jgi:hypothetical protein
MAELEELKSVADQVSTEEWQIRQDLACLYRIVAHHGWDDFLFTHLSVRVPGPEHHFLLNPLGLMFEEVTASSLVKVDVEGNKVMETPYDVNPAGFTIHSAVHMAREDAHCVMHLHTDDGVAVSAQESGLLPITQHAMQLGEIAYHDYEGVALDLECLYGDVLPAAGLHDADSSAVRWRRNQPAAPGLSRKSRAAEPGSVRWNGRTARLAGRQAQNDPC